MLCKYADMLLPLQVLLLALCTEEITKRLLFYEQFGGDLPGCGDQPPPTPGGATRGFMLVPVVVVLRGRGGCWG